MQRPVYVVGAGAIGSTLGGLFGGAGPVTLVGRPAHVEAIRPQGGVRLRGCRAGLYPVEALSRVQELPPAALVLVTVKAFDLETTLKPLAPQLDASHLVLVLQNGLGIKRLAEQVLARPVIQAVTFMAAAAGRPGSVVLNAIGKTYLSTGEEFASLWRSAKLPVEVVGEIETYVWRKLAINAVINPLSALLGVTNGELLNLQPLVRALVDELVAVARCEGHELDADETLAKVVASMRQTARNTSSMLQDVQRGRQTEIDWLNGAIVQAARQHRLAVPHHEQICQLLRFVATRAREAGGTLHLKPADLQRTS